MRCSTAAWARAGRWATCCTRRMPATSSAVTRATSRRSGSTCGARTGTCTTRATPRSARSTSRCGTCEARPSGNPSPRCWASLGSGSRATPPPARSTRRPSRSSRRRSSGGPTGYRGFKIQFWDGLERDIPRFHAAREAAGPDFPLMEDAAGGYTYIRGDWRAGRELQALGLHLVRGAASRTARLVSSDGWRISWTSRSWPRRRLRLHELPGASAARGRGHRPRRRAHQGRHHRAAQGAASPPSSSAMTSRSTAWAAVPRTWRTSMWRCRSRTAASSRRTPGLRAGRRGPSAGHRSGRLPGAARRAGPGRRDGLGLDRRPHAGDHPVGRDTVVTPS